MKAVDPLRAQFGMTDNFQLFSADALVELFSLSTWEHSSFEFLNPNVHSKDHLELKYLKKKFLKTCLHCVTSYTC